MLVPKLRFKREDGTDYPEWEKDKWSALGDFVASGTLSKADLAETGTPCILYGELYTKYGEIAHTIYSKTSATSHTFSQYDDVILPKSGETPEDISTATCVPYDNISLGGDLIVFRHNEKVIGAYLSYLISNRAKNAIASIAQGKSVVHINEKSLANIELSYPDTEEQQKIADFLSAYDEAIRYAKQELDKWKEVKKGLLQQMFV
ncbi:MAG: restriction endonuclease subunit S [Oscillospiraceae bacterium]|nr:restriction endonuclease subunit S [Oscillospiraceae bacterium]